MPSTIQQIHKEFEPRGLAILAVDIQEPRAKVAQWVKANGVTVPVLLDADGAVTQTYRVTGTPTVVLVGKDGNLVGRGVGSRSWTSSAGRALLNALVDGRP